MKTRTTVLLFLVAAGGLAVAAPKKGAKETPETPASSTSTVPGTSSSTTTPTNPTDAPAKKTGGKGGGKDQGANLFRNLDTDGDGMLSASELSPKLDPEKAKEILAKFDSDKDGLLSMQEFIENGAIASVETADTTLGGKKGKKKDKKDKPKKAKKKPAV